MSKLLAVLLLSALPLAALAAPESYTFDPYHTIANFTVDHFDTSTVYGRFNKVSGKLVVDLAAKTGSVAEFPTMTFKSTAVKFNGDTPATLEGNLTLLGVTKPLTLTIERFKCGPRSGSGKEGCGGNATGKLKRSDFGMKTGIPAVGDEITLHIGFEAAKG